MLGAVGVGCVVGAVGVTGARQARWVWRVRWVQWRRRARRAAAAGVEAYIGFYPPLHSAPTSEVPGHPYVRAIA